MGASTILLVVAIIIFVLAGFNVTVGSLDETDLIAFGLACFAGSFLAP